jgi:hypothetical protein
MATSKKNSMKNAGKSKAAVMNSRSPKKPMAISGDTMNSGSMYKKGGRVKKSLTKAQAGKQTRQPGDDLSISNAVREIIKNPSGDNLMNQGLILNPITQLARAGAEGITRVGAALGNKRMKEDVAKRDSTYEAHKRELQGRKSGGKVSKYKKGGKVKKYNTGGVFGSYVKKRKETDEEGNSITKREIKNPITGIKTSATIRRSADGDKAKSTVKESYKKGGKIKSKSKK